MPEHLLIETYPARELDIDNKLNNYLKITGILNNHRLCVVSRRNRVSNRHRAILWLLASIVTFRAQCQRDLTLQDFHEVLKLTRWKLYQSTKRHALVGDWGIATAEWMRGKSRGEQYPGQRS